MIDDIERIVHLVASTTIDAIREDQAIYSSAAARPTGDLTPAVLATAIVPAVGSTVIDFPTVSMVGNIAIHQRAVRPKFEIKSGFSFKKEGNTLIVSDGTIQVNDEEKHIEGCTFDLSRWSSAPYILIVVDTQKEKVELTLSRLPHHLFVGVINP